MIPSLFSRVVAASPTAHKFEPTYAFKEDSQPMRLFRRMDEEPESLWSVERIMETFNLPRSSVTTALRRLAKKGLIELAGKQLRHTKPRYLWRVKGEGK